MTDRPLLVFDFDGVIVMAWPSTGGAHAWLLALLPRLSSSVATVPEAFRQLRPWVHHGWEMVLLAAELADLEPEAWIRDYDAMQRQAMQRRGWQAEQLQDALDQTRQQAVRTDRDAWLALHQPYPGMVDRLSTLASEEADWAVLTTKSEAFTAELLSSMGLQPWRLDGRESGSKPEVLLALQRERPLRAFVEDRRATLETVLATPGLEHLPCLLVSWGYLRPMDRRDLPKGMHLLQPIDLAAPLADWP